MSAARRVRIECLAYARHYTLVVINEATGERLAEPLTGIPAWRIVQVREDLFDDWIGSGASEVSMGIIPELRSLEVAGWRRGGVQ